MHARPAAVPIALVLLLALALAACGGGSGSAGGGASDAASDSAAGGSEAGATGGAEASQDGAAGGSEAGATGGAEVSQDSAGVEVSGAIDAKPSISVPGGEPPTDLRIIDLVEGEGDEVAPGATVTIQYVGASWLNEGQEFDASWDRGQPATFPLGQLIPGWQEGIPGMKPGGRRLLIIPPELGYGPSSPTPAIAPNDTLVFVIDMIEAT